MLVTVKSYGKDTYKVIFHKHGKKAKGGLNYEWSDERVEGGCGGSGEDCGAVGKELSNLYRAKSKVRECALCNEWDYFLTLTLDKRKQDRYDLDGYVRDLGTWIGNYNKKYHTKLQYLLIPEQHKDGGWHMHGMFRGIAPESLVRNEYGYLTMPYYAERFGYISLSPVRDGKRTASYITKYIAKAFGHTLIGLCKHSYYRSQGLQEAYDIGEYACDEIPSDVWQNEYCGIAWCSSDEELQQMIERVQKHGKKEDDFILQ